MWSQRPLPRGYPQISVSEVPRSYKGSQTFTITGPIPERIDQNATSLDVEGHIRQTKKFDLVTSNPRLPTDKDGIPRRFFVGEVYCPSLADMGQMDRPHTRPFLVMPPELHRNFDPTVPGVLKVSDCPNLLDFMSKIGQSGQNSQRITQILNGTVLLDGSLQNWLSFPSIPDEEIDRFTGASNIAGLVDRPALIDRVGVSALRSVSYPLSDGEQIREDNLMKQQTLRFNTGAPRQLIRDANDASDVLFDQLVIVRQPAGDSIGRGAMAGLILSSLLFMFDYSTAMEVFLSGALPPYLINPNVHFISCLSDGFLVTNGDMATAESRRAVLFANLARKGFDVRHMGLSLSVPMDYSDILNLDDPYPKVNLKNLSDAVFPDRSQGIEYRPSLSFIPIISEVMAPAPVNVNAIQFRNVGGAQALVGYVEPAIPARANPPAVRLRVFSNAPGFEGLPVASFEKMSIPFFFGFGEKREMTATYYTPFVEGGVKRVRALHITFFSVASNPGALKVGDFVFAESSRAPFKDSENLSNTDKKSAPDYHSGVFHGDGTRWCMTAFRGMLNAVAGAAIPDANPATFANDKFTSNRFFLHNAEVAVPPAIILRVEAVKDSGAAINRNSYRFSHFFSPLRGRVDLADGEYMGQVTHIKLAYRSIAPIVGRGGFNMPGEAPNQHRHLMFYRSSAPSVSIVRLARQNEINLVINNAVEVLSSDRRSRTLFCEGKKFSQYLVLSYEGKDNPFSADTPSFGTGSSFSGVQGIPNNQSNAIVVNSPYGGDAYRVGVDVEGNDHVRTKIVVHSLVV